MARLRLGHRRRRQKKQRCRTCRSDNAKRICPALNGVIICPSCCQAKRAKIPGCDANCQYYKPLIKQSKFGPFPDYPLHSCLISHSTDTGLRIAVIVRRRPDGNLRAMFLLLDFWKRGVRDCFVVANLNPAELDRCCQSVAKSYQLSLPIDELYSQYLSGYTESNDFGRSLTRKNLQSENLALNKRVETNSDYAGRWNLTDGDTGESAKPEDLLDATQVTVDLGQPMLINTIKLWHYWADGRAYHHNKVAVSLENKFDGEEITVFDSQYDGEYAESREGKTLVFNPIETRYIRCWADGNSVNQWTHFVELQAFLIPNQNLALNKRVETNSDYAGRWNLTDGDTGESAKPEDLLDATQVTVDLGQPMLINTIKLWHYWADGRAYHHNKVAVSLENKFDGEEITVFDSQYDGEYAESREGKTLVFNPIETRYIRCWADGNSVNQWTHFVELQAFLTLNVLTNQFFSAISFADCQTFIRHAYEISIKTKNELPWEFTFWQDFTGDIEQIPYDNNRSLYRCPKCDEDLPDESVELMTQYALKEDIQFYILCRKCGGEFD